MEKNAQAELSFTIQQICELCEPSPSQSTTMVEDHPDSALTESTQNLGLKRSYFHENLHYWYADCMKKPLDDTNPGISSSVYEYAQFRAMKAPISSKFLPRSKSLNCLESTVLSPEFLQSLSQTNTEDEPKHVYNKNKDFFNKNYNDNVDSQDILQGENSDPANVTTFKEEIDHSHSAPSSSSFDVMDPTMKIKQPSQNVPTKLESENTVLWVPYSSVSTPTLINFFSEPINSEQNRLEKKIRALKRYEQFYLDQIFNYCSPRQLNLSSEIDMLPTIEVLSAIHDERIKLLERAQELKLVQTTMPNQNQSSYSFKINAVKKLHLELISLVKKLVNLRQYHGVHNAPSNILNVYLQMKFELSEMLISITKLIV